MCSISGQSLKELRECAQSATDSVPGQRDTRSTLAVPHSVLILFSAERSCQRRAKRSAAHKAAAAAAAAGTRKAHWISACLSLRGRGRMDRGRLRTLTERSEGDESVLFDSGEHAFVGGEMLRAGGLNMSLRIFLFSHQQSLGVTQGSERERNVFIAVTASVFCVSGNIRVVEKNHDVQNPCSRTPVCSMLQQ